ncbi:MAG TPA: histidine kinase [Daejeonella sp.]|nr:histidine kinase [Daejeonella sp.]
MRKRRRRKYRSPYLDMVEISLVIVVAGSFVLPFLYFLLEGAPLSKIAREGLNILLIFSIQSMLIGGLILLSDKLSFLIKSAWLRQLLELMAVLLVSVLLLERIYLLTEKFPSPGNFKLFMGMNLLGTAFVYLFQKGLFLKQKLAERTNETQLLQKDFNQYRLQALKNQVNPHFLFNSLSVLSSLVHKNADLAEKFVIRLSEAYTYILNQKEAGHVPLAEELKFLESYFFLLQIRFENKLQLDIRVDEAEGYSIPPLILQLLLENAVKHNKMSEKMPLKLTVTQKGKQLLVENNVNKRDAKEESTGLGLENIRNRYLMVNQSEIRIDNGDEKFSITIPLIPN